MLIRPRKIVVAGFDQITCDALAAAIGMRAVDEVLWQRWYNPTNSDKLDADVDVIVVRTNVGENPNLLRIRVRDIALANPHAKIVVAAGEVKSGRLDAHAVVHNPSLEELAEAIKPLLPSGTIDA